VSWEAYGGAFDFCGHRHTSWEEAARCAKESRRATVVDLDAITVLPDGTWEFAALSVNAYASGGETVDLSEFVRGGKVAP